MLLLLEATDTYLRFKSAESLITEHVRAHSARVMLNECDILVVSGDAERKKKKKQFEGRSHEQQVWVFYASGTLPVVVTTSTCVTIVSNLVYHMEN